MRPSCTVWGYFDFVRGEVRIRIIINVVWLSDCLWRIFKINLLSDLSVCYTAREHFLHELTLWMWRNRVLSYQEPFQHGSVSFALLTVEKNYWLSIAADFKMCCRSNRFRVLICQYSDFFPPLTALCQIVFALLFTFISNIVSHKPKVKLPDMFFGHFRIVCIQGEIWK